MTKLNDKEKEAIYKKLKDYQISLVDEEHSSFGDIQLVSEEYFSEKLDEALEELENKKELNKEKEKIVSEVLGFYNYREIQFAIEETHNVKHNSQEENNQEKFIELLQFETLKEVLGVLQKYFEKVDE